MGGALAPFTLYQQGPKRKKNLPNFRNLHNRNKFYSLRNLLEYAYAMQAF